VHDRKLSKMNFLRVMMIMFNRQEVASKELKDKLAASRIALIKAKGFDSLEYI